jgi:soluble lytic murein transglycosylase-like protein
VTWRYAVTALAAVAIAAFAGPVCAEVWAYVDGEGVAHIAPSRVDSRYRLVLGDVGTADPAAPQRVPGKTDRTGGLLTWLDIAPEVRVLQPLLREVAREHGVDVELLKAIIAVESGFNARAVSRRGAVGLMQITAATADRYATPGERQRPAAQRLLDPRINVQTGARMLADLTRRFGDIAVALAAWNAGEGTVRKHRGRVPPIDETRAHVHLVLELYWALLQQSHTLTARQMQVHPPGP